MSNAMILEDASKFWIPTPMASRLRDRIEQCLQCGDTGCVIVGEARLGKTLAIRRIINELTNRSGEPIHAFYTHYGQRDTETVRAVFAKIARALGAEVDRQTADKLLDWITLHLADAALANSTRQVALIVDEAQLLTAKQLNAFAEIYNELVEMRVNCSIFFVANLDQFRQLARNLMKTENRYVRERFFYNVEYFFGIRSEKELATCLNQYDEYRIDEGPGRQVTEFFCTELYEQGWKLASIAPFYWRHYREHYASTLGQQSFGMAQFVRATNLLVMDYLPHCTDKDNTALIEACVVKSLAGAGIEPSLAKLIGTKE
tara:strand:- start:4260 stop:5210 length:951 start_codon:yes stop_codon:yes gene_type:complete